MFARYVEMLVFASPVWDTLCWCMLYALHRLCRSTIVCPCSPPPIIVDAASQKPLLWMDGSCFSETAHAQAPLAHCRRGKCLVPEVHALSGSDAFSGGLVIAWPPLRDLQSQTAIGPCRTWAVVAAMGPRSSIDFVRQHTPVSPLRDICGCDATVTPLRCNKLRPPGPEMASPSLHLATGFFILAIFYCAFALYFPTVFLSEMCGHVPLRPVHCSCFAVVSLDMHCSDFHFLSCPR